MVYKTFNVPLDLKQPGGAEFEVVENDNGNIIVITLTDDGTPVDLSSCRVIACFSRPDGVVVEQDTNDHGVTVSGENNNVVTVDLYIGSFSSGVISCELQVFSGENYTNLVTSAQFDFRCRRSIVNDDTIQSREEFPILVELISEAETAISDAQSAVAFLSNFWTGTQAEYDALDTHAAGTLYFILQEDDA